jgi:hypothetical protein
MPPSGAARALLLTVAFTAIFSGVVPWLLVSYYGTKWKPLDWYPEQSRGGDYLVTYSAANRLRVGLPLYPGSAQYGPPFDPPVQGPYAYPPFHAYAFIPLSVLPWETSYLVWEYLTIGLIVASCILAARLTRWAWPSFVCLLMLYGQSSFLQFQLERGQTDAVTLFLTVLTIYLYVRGPRNPYMAGAVLALGAVFKLLPGALVLFFLLRREIRVLATAAVVAIPLILLTGFGDWMYWIATTLPYYSNYFLGLNVDHSLTYFLQGFTDLLTALKVSRIIVGALLVVFCGLVLINHDRGRYMLVELAILTTLVELATPWSANYKLVVLVFLFLAPFALLEIEFVRRRPVLFQAPLFLAWVLVIPVFGEFVTRLPYSLLVNILPAQVILSNPLDPYITDRKVATGLLFCLMYLLILYAVVAVGTSPIRDRLVRRIPAFRYGSRRLNIAAALAILVVVAAGVPVYAAKQYAQEAGEFRAVADNFGDRSMNDFVSLAGYRIRSDAPTHYKIDIVFRSIRPLPHNLQIYLHARQPGPTGELTTVSGRNFFPSIITSFWPGQHYVVASTDTFLYPLPYTLDIGFFDLSDGMQYGAAATDVIDFAGVAVSP